MAAAGSACISLISLLTTQWATTGGRNVPNLSIDERATLALRYVIALHDEPATPGWRTADHRLRDYLGCLELLPAAACRVAQSAAQQMAGRAGEAPGAPLG